MRPILFLSMMAGLGSAAAAGVCPSGLEGNPIVTRSYEGLRNTKPLVVDRELKQGVGDSLSCRILDRERRALEGLDLFATVDPEVTDTLEGVAVRWRFKELLQNLPFVAFRKTDEDGTILGPAFASLNLLGRDIRLEAYARARVLPDLWGSSELLLQAESPWLGDLHLGWALLASRFDSWDALDSGRRTGYEGRIEISRPVREWRILSAAGILDMETSRPEMSLGGDPDIVPSLYLGLARDTRDALQDVRSGAYLEAGVGQGGGILGGEADHALLLADLRAWATPHPRWTLHATTLARTRPGTVAPWDLYRAGGSSTLRGFETGDLQGRDEILGMFELRWRLIERSPWSLFGIPSWYALQPVAGLDAAALGTTDEAQRAFATYAGVHLLLPAIDRLRLEVARDVDGGPVRVSFGLYERSAIQRWRVR